MIVINRYKTWEEPEFKNLIMTATLERREGVS